METENKFDYYIGIDPYKDNISKGAICIINRNRKIISIYNTKNFWSRIRFIWTIWKYKYFHNSIFLVEENT